MAIAAAERAVQANIAKTGPFYAGVFGLDAVPTTWKKIVNAKFEVLVEEDILSLSRCYIPPLKMDAIVSFGALGRLANWSEQEIAIHEMRKCLNPRGIIVLIEQFQEGLDNLNAVRAYTGLSAQLTSDANTLIPQPQFMNLMQGNGGIMGQEYSENIGNFYCIVRDCMGINDPAVLERAKKMPTFGEFYACSPYYMVVVRVT